MDDFLYVLQCELEEKLTGEQILYQLNLFKDLSKNGCTLFCNQIFINTWCNLNSDNS